MADALSPEVSARICTHMNEDHADAVLMYVQVFGSFPQATSAKLLSVEPSGMEIVAMVESEPTPVHISFDHTLVDSEDAHQTLIAMVKEARLRKTAL